MASISQIFLPEEFTYQFFEQNRYTISEGKSYEALCNNGFTKLYAPNGRIYWHVQNEFSHLTPDWKFHISVKHEQLPQAWNLIAGLFITMKCRSGMKTYYLKECVEPQPGRQITVYILKYQDLYKKSTFANDFELSRAEEHSEEYWYEFVKNVENTLEAHGIEPNGLAPGDLQIGKYVSLRNEAFIVNGKGQNVYPPNDFGWNAAEQQVPLNLNKLREYLNKKDEDDENKSLSTKNKNSIISFAIPIVLVTLYYLTTKGKSL